jgi:hypothetical protein
VRVNPCAQVRGAHPGEVVGETFGLPLVPTDSPVDLAVCPGLGDRGPFGGIAANPPPPLSRRPAVAPSPFSPRDFPGSELAPPPGSSGLPRTAGVQDGAGALFRGLLAAVDSCLAGGRLRKLLLGRIGLGLVRGLSLRSLGFRSLLNLGFLSLHCLNLRRGRWLCPLGFCLNR